MDYNPSFQFIDELDMAEILVQSVNIPTGVYNVAPRDTLPIRDALSIFKNNGFPLPLFLAAPLAKLFRRMGSPFPDYLFEYLKYPCLIDSSLIEKHLESLPLKLSSQKALHKLASSLKISS